MSRRTCGRRCAASGSPRSGWARPCTPPPSASAPATRPPTTVAASCAIRPTSSSPPRSPSTSILTARAREIARQRWSTVIVDEIHALVGTKRGAHLMPCPSSASRRSPGHATLQRIGLSATQRPLDEVARYPRGGPRGSRRHPGGPVPSPWWTPGCRKELRPPRSRSRWRTCRDLGDRRRSPPPARWWRATASVLERRSDLARRSSPGSSSWSATHRSTHRLRQTARRLARSVSPPALNELAGDPVAPVPEPDGVGGRRRRAGRDGCGRG